MNNIDDIIEAATKLKRLMGGDSFTTGVATAPSTGAVDPSPHPYIGRKVFVRCPGSGVFFCTLGKSGENYTILEDANRIWSWEGALDILTLAVKGPKTAKISLPATLTVPDAREIVLALETACEVMKDISPHVS